MKNVFFSHSSAWILTWHEDKAGGCRLLWKVAQNLRIMSKWSGFYRSHFWFLPCWPSIASWRMNGSVCLYAEAFVPFSSIYYSWKTLIWGIEILVPISLERSPAVKEIWTSLTPITSCPPLYPMGTDPNLPTTTTRPLVDHSLIRWEIRLYCYLSRYPLLLDKDES